MSQFRKVILNPFLVIFFLSLSLLSCQQDTSFIDGEDLVASHASLQTQLFSESTMNSLSKQILNNERSQKLVNEALSHFLLENYATFKSEIQSLYPMTTIQWISKRIDPSVAKAPLAVNPLKEKESPSSIFHERSIQGGVPFDHLLTKSVADNATKGLKANYFIGFRIELTWKDKGNSKSLSNGGGQVLGPKYGETASSWQTYVQDAKEERLQAKMKISLIIF